MWLLVLEARKGGRCLDVERAALRADEEVGPIVASIQGRMDHNLKAAPAEQREEVQLPPCRVVLMVVVLAEAITQIASCFASREGGEPSIELISYPCPVRLGDSV